MNVVEKVGNLISAYKGNLPESPDTAVAVYAYDAGLMLHTFCKTYDVYGIQVRCRSDKPSTAYQNAANAVVTLGRYIDSEIAVIQATPILDIGNDSKGRREYTVNFTIRNLV